MRDNKPINHGSEFFEIAKSIVRSHASIVKKEWSRPMTEADDAVDSEKDDKREPGHQVPVPPPLVPSPIIPSMNNSSQKEYFPSQNGINPSPSTNNSTFPVHECSRYKLIPEGILDTLTNEYINSKDYLSLHIDERLIQLCKDLNTGYTTREGFHWKRYNPKKEFKFEVSIAVSPNCIESGMSNSLKSAIQSSLEGILPYSYEGEVSIDVREVYE